ncbi:MAG: hypothetical protein OHK0039_46300 [Bacteroidia bacterium]
MVSHNTIAMRSFISLLFLLAFLSFLPAQTLLKQVAIVNGGQFGNPADNANLYLYDPAAGTGVSLDTIQTQSIQDILLEDHYAYVAAQDSIVKYDLAAGQRVAAQAFGGASTISLGLYGDYLLVGNWYAPFGWTGPYPNHFRIFDKHSLTLVDSIPAVQRGAIDFVVLGDTAYIVQNYTTASFSDSAGYLAVVDLRTRTWVRDIVLDDNGLGRLLVQDSVIYALNPGSDTRLAYDSRTGAWNSLPIAADLQLRGNGSQLAQYDGRTYCKMNGGLGSLDVVGGLVLDSLLIDTAVTAFALDTLGGRFFITQTDFFSYTQGGIYDMDGVKTGSLPVGSAPEAIAVVYNRLPEATADSGMVMAGQTLRLAVLANDRDPEGYALTAQVLDLPGKGTAAFDGDTLVYTWNQLDAGRDSLSYVVADVWGDADTAWVQIAIGQTEAIDSAMQALRAWPNPAGAAVTLRTARGDVQAWHLLDMQGRSLRAGLLRGETTIPLDGLPAGVYLLRAGTASLRLIKQ